MSTKRAFSFEQTARKPLSRARRALRMARTLRHLKPWQVGGRLVAMLRARLPVRLPEPPRRLRGALHVRVPMPQHDPWNTAEDIRLRRFCFLNERADLRNPVRWRAPGMPLLWRFNLHYFHYLHLLEPDEQALLCRDWMSAHPPGMQPAWHAYPTSLRIVNWCRANVQDADLQASLYAQAAHLYRNLETHVMGNHLLENARALVFAGRFFAGQGEADRWLDKGLALYRRETPEQILPDGGHFERSPMYHALMLEGYLDVLNLLPEGHADEAYFRDVCTRMTSALQAFVHPDGSLALFNDSTQEIALAPATLLAYADVLLGVRPAPRFDLPETGYYALRNGGWYFIADAGPAGPDYLMAHAHADVFSFELSVGGHPFVVDTGVYHYAPGPARDYVRRTAAHSTVEVDGLDQVEVWGSFRVGYRAAPQGVSCSRGARSLNLEGRFEGYAPQVGAPLVHHRVFDADAAAGMLHIRDMVDGEGVHRLVSRLTLHPDVEVQVDGSVAHLRQGAQEVVVEASHPIVVQQGVWCPRFGTGVLRPVLAMEHAGELPHEMTWRVRDRLPES